jgi:hypothetical protein
MAQCQNAESVCKSAVASRFPPTWTVADLQQRSTNLSRPPQIGPCVHTIRGEHLIPPLGWEKPGAEVRKCERPPGEAASSLGAERLGGFGGWGSRSTWPNVLFLPRDLHWRCDRRHRKVDRLICYNAITAFEGKFLPKCNGCVRPALTRRSARSAGVMGCGTISRLG